MEVRQIEGIQIINHFCADQKDSSIKEKDQKSQEIFKKIFSEIHEKNPTRALSLAHLVQAWDLMKEKDPEMKAFSLEACLHLSLHHYQRILELNIKESLLDPEILKHRFSYRSHTVLNPKLVRKNDVNILFKLLSKTTLLESELLTEIKFKVDCFRNTANTLQHIENQDEKKIKDIFSDYLKNNQQQAALALSLYIHSRPYVEEAIHYGANINAIDSNGNTYLHRSVLAEDGVLVKFLCELGADANIRNYSLKFPLHLAKSEEIYNTLSPYTSYTYEPLLEKHYAAFHSRLRRMEHLKRIRLRPRTAKIFKPLFRLFAEEEKNIRIIRTIEKLKTSIDSIFSWEVDHWTSYKNLKSIFSNGLLGKKALVRLGIDYRQNVLSTPDEENLDGNVVCLCPGKFVDPKVAFKQDWSYRGKLWFLKKNIVILRLNAKEIRKEGLYNTFFKITDLLGPELSKYIKISPFFHIQIQRSGRGQRIGVKGNTQSRITVYFKFHSLSEEISYNKQECLFYGSIIQIHEFCVSLFFTSLEKIKEKKLANHIYQYLQKLNEEEITKLIVEFARGMTKISELNIRGILDLGFKVISNVHFIDEEKTYPIDQIDEEHYQSSLQKLLTDKKSELSPFSEKVLTIKKNSQRKEEISLYGEAFCQDREFFRFSESYLNFT